jgi:hypothetical protein
MFTLLIEESRMLHSAFLEKLYGETSKINQKHLEKVNKVWSYVGRFITEFASVEYEVNQLCHELMGNSFLGNIFVTYTLDLRKKLDLVEALLEEGPHIKEWKMLKDRLHKFHDIRNINAHWPFSDDLSGRGMS